MHGRKFIIVLFSLVTLSACSTGAKYANTPPGAAIRAMATEFGGERVNAVSTQHGASMSLPKEAADRTLKAALDYCYARGGRGSNWGEAIGACIDVNTEHEIFVVKNIDLEHGNVVLQVAEFTPSNGSELDYYLKVVWGYTTIAETQREQAAKIKGDRLSQEYKRQRLTEKRLNERHKVSYVGAPVCQDLEPTTSFGGSITLMAVVEQVEGNRIKIFVERAVMTAAPNLSPGGFSQHYGWVNVWDVYPCS